MGRIGEKLTVRFPSAGEKYDALGEATFRHDLERLLDRLGSEISGGQAVMANVDLDTTLSVARADAFTITNSAPTTITALNDGVIGQEVVLIFADGNTTIQDASVAGIIQLSGGASWNPSVNDTLDLFFDGTGWFEISRSVN